MSVAVLVRRILRLVPVFFGVTFVSFLLIRGAPGDGARFYLTQRGIDLSADALSSARQELGLERSLLGQYTAYLEALLTGNLGVSQVTREPVAAELPRRFGVTFLLALTTVPWVLFVAFPLGIACALHPDTVFDKTIQVFSVLFLAIPAFCLGYILILVVRVRFHGAFWGGGEYFLASITLGVGVVGYYSRYIRGVLLEEFAQEYVKAAKAQGFSRLQITRQCFKSAGLPLLSSLGVSFGFLLGGQGFVEKLYGLPGVGSYLLDGILQRDYPVVDGCVVFLAVLFASINLCVDILCVFLNPRYEV